MSIHRALGQTFGVSFVFHFSQTLQVAILRERKGSYLLETLSSGKRSLCVKIVNKAHVPIGIGQCIQVTVK